MSSLVSVCRGVVPAKFFIKTTNLINVSSGARRSFDAYIEGLVRGMSLANKRQRYDTDKTPKAYANSASYSTETLFLRGFVYDYETCVLMTALSGTISQYTSVKWTTPGSRSLICNYFKGRELLWDEALRTACAALNVRVQRFSTRTLHIDGDKTCILGEGVVGRVFRVTRDVEGNAPQELAMKVVLGQEASDELGSECYVASNLPTTLDDVIIRPIPQTLWRGVYGADAWRRVSAFLLNLVGEPFHHPDDISDADGRLILETLSDLHDDGIVHGDARYKNVVKGFRTWPTSVPLDRSW